MRGGTNFIPKNIITVYFEKEKQKFRDILGMNLCSI